MPESGFSASPGRESAAPDRDTNRHPRPPWLVEHPTHHHTHARGSPHGPREDHPPHERGRHAKRLPRQRRTPIPTHPRPPRPTSPSHQRHLPKLRHHLRLHQPQQPPRLHRRPPHTTQRRRKPQRPTPHRHVPRLQRPQTRPHHPNPQTSHLTHHPPHTGSTGGVSKTPDTPTGPSDAVSVRFLSQGSFVVAGVIRGASS